MTSVHVSPPPLQKINKWRGRRYPILSKQTWRIMRQEIPNLPGHSRQTTSYFWRGSFGSSAQFSDAASVPSCLRAPCPRGAWGQTAAPGCEGCLSAAGPLPWWLPGTSGVTLSPRTRTGGMGCDWDGRRKRSVFCWLKECWHAKHNSLWESQGCHQKRCNSHRVGEVCLLDWSLGFSLWWGIFSLQNRLVYVNMHTCECVCSRRYKTRQSTICSRERSMTTGWEQSLLSTCFQQAPEPFEILKKGLAEEHSYSYCCHCQSLQHM